MLRFLAATFKILLASLITGAGLSFFDLSSAELLARIGMTPEEVWAYLVRAVNWAVPNILLGSLIVVPVWLLTYIFLPPRGDA
ncbi:DUF6460 domain-containing protein [Rhizobium sp. SG2393]|uniref:DUF6460 domain-containing protein n=1 Tax=Rhizobium sp. SG2393 TaxID=3276279 RepID=UPI0036703E09